MQKKVKYAEKHAKKNNNEKWINIQCFASRAEEPQSFFLPFFYFSYFHVEKKIHTRQKKFQLFVKVKKSYKFLNSGQKHAKYTQKNGEICKKRAKYAEKR